MYFAFFIFLSSIHPFHGYKPPQHFVPRLQTLSAQCFTSTFMFRYFHVRSGPSPFHWSMFFTIKIAGVGNRPASKCFGSEIPSGRRDSGSNGHFATRVNFWRGSLGECHFNLGNVQDGEEFIGEIAWFL